MKRICTWEPEEDFEVMLAIREMQKEVTTDFEEVDCQHIADLMNKLFYRQDPVMYTRKTWQQMRAKACSMRSKFIEVQLGLNEEAKAREQVSSAPCMLICHCTTSASCSDELTCHADHRMQPSMTVGNQRCNVVRRSILPGHDVLLS